MLTEKQEGRQAYRKVVKGLKELHSRIVEGASPIKEGKKGESNAAFKVYKRSGKEEDKGRAILELLNTKVINLLCFKAAIGEED